MEEKNQSIVNNIDSNEMVKQNCKKVKYFMEMTDNNKPVLPSDIPMIQLIRQYLNDDDLKITCEGQSVYSAESTDQNIQLLYRVWLTKAQKQKTIDQFIIYWIESSPKLQVHYSLYDDKIKQEMDYQPSFQKTTFEKQLKTLEDQKAIIRTNEGHYNSISSLGRLTYPQASPNELLYRFFVHYSKKQVNFIKNATFNQYEQYYNSISLTKWMQYIKDINISRFSKKLNSKKIKQIFIKYQTKDKILNFQEFKSAVHLVLNIIYQNDEEKVKKQGYEIIGIKNLHYFASKFKQMGQLMPVYQNAHNRNLQKCQKKLNELSYKPNRIQKIQQVRLGSPSSLFSETGLSQISNSMRLTTLKTKNSPPAQGKIHQDIHENDNGLSLINNQQQYIISQKIKKQKYKKTKQHEGLLQQLMKEEIETDPYLQRYNNKQNAGRYRCIAHRIDERIQKIQIKYDYDSTQQPRK